MWLPSEMPSLAEKPIPEGAQETKLRAPKGVPFPAASSAGRVPS